MSSYDNVIPNDILMVQRIMAEYGFTEDNCDPLIINQILALVQRSASNIYAKADVIRESSNEPFITPEHYHQTVYTTEVYEAISQQAQVEAQFELHASHVNQTPLPIHPSITSRWSLPISSDCIRRVRDEVSVGPDYILLQQEQQTTQFSQLEQQVPSTMEDPTPGMDSALQQLQQQTIDEPAQQPTTAAAARAGRRRKQ
eukprot:UN03647